MGIRFQCPNGHKINVKAFLAGKKALCPHCGAKVVVPMESQAASALTAAVDAQRLAAGMATESPAAVSALENLLPDVLGGPTIPSAPLPGNSTTTTAAPVTAHGPQPRSSESRPSETPVAPRADARPNAASIAIGPPPLSPALADPIAEAPQAVWYVRPRSGGQFGPAAGDLLRQWVSERRVSADSLVWRDGWPDWRLASEVLPQFAPAPPLLGGVTASLSPAMPAVSVPRGTSAAVAATSDQNSPAARYVRSRRSRTSTLVAIGVLAVIAVSLIGVLIWVLLHPK